MSISEQIAALEAKTSIQFVRNPIKAKSDDWQQTAHQWLIIFPNGKTQDYFTGLGHRVSGKWASQRDTFKSLQHKNLTDHGLASLLGASTPTKPTLKDILECLAMDAQSAQENFHDWCDSLGYSNDSLKAVNIYKACCETAEMLRGLGFNVDALAEFFYE